MKKNPLIQSLEGSQAMTLTDNGAVTRSTTFNAVLDLFSMGGSLRQRPESEIQKLFIAARHEDALLALKCLFHIRNVRGGMGERRTFRTILKYLANNSPELVQKNIANIVHFGRFDDLYELFDTKCEKDAMNFMAAQLDDDFKKMQNKERVSLAAKWAKSLNASSKETRRLADKFRAFLKLSERDYRKALSSLRAYSDVLEVALSKGQWKDLDYSKLPSRAGWLYRKAFSRHDPTGYQTFLTRAAKGEVKVNAATLFPYDIVQKILFKGETGQTADVMWNALPDYLNGSENNVICVCDVSGSMTCAGGLPMATSVSLGIYTAERNRGAFKDYFLTFSSSPRLQKIVGNGIVEKVNMLSRADWGGSTNLQATFALLLDHAVSNRVPENDMPSQVIIISDMEFNSCGQNTNLDAIRAKYKQAGYTLPQLVFWNVNSTKDNVAAKANDKGVILVSGSSPIVFKTLMSGASYTPVDQMLETLGDSQYDRVTV